MQTITIDVIDEKVLKLPRELEILDLIRLRGGKPGHKSSVDWTKYKGAIRRTHKIKLPDAIIAATALISHGM